MRRSVLAALSALVIATSLAACGGSGTTGPATAKATNAASRCTPPDGYPPVVATAVPGVASDWNLTSFDGTRIRLHWFPLSTATAHHRAPTILMGPGWGASGDVDTTSTDLSLFASISIRQLWSAGYNVLTWDPRGFGASSGAVEIDSPSVEGRDVERIIDFLSTRPGVLLDARRDPRLGMVGLSYGGGIQLSTAAVDCRVDAIVPGWAWHSLTTSLYKADTVKSGWSTLLYEGAAGHKLDPHIVSAYNESTGNGVLDAANQAWFAQRGPGTLVGRIKIPTLFIQGEADNLFTLNEAVQNYESLQAHKVTTAMLWMCSGHGICLTNPGNPQTVNTAILHWLARYVERDTAVATGPGFRFIDQNGASYQSSAYPPPAGAPLTANGSGTLTLVAGGGSGPVHATGSSDPLASVAGAITPARATHALDVDVPVGSKPVVVVGAPSLRLTYSGTTPPGAAPTRVFAQIVDDTSGLVLGNQVTPIAVTLDGAPHTTTVPLEIVAYAGKPGDRLTLQLVATTVAYATPRLGGTITFSGIGISLPTTTLRAG